MSNTRENVLELRSAISNSILGQQKLITQLIVCLLADGHVLLEGKPGLAKTRLAHSVAKNMEASFQRIQFTPDLTPNDIVGVEFRDNNSETGFRFRKGPIFNNVVLADELNRSPPIVQSALLEAMEEKQVTISGETHKLSDVFFVIATQNPFSQHGTFALPEAQLDRFMMHLVVDYPSPEVEQRILQIARAIERGEFIQDVGTSSAQISPEVIREARKEIAQIQVPDQVEKYITRIMQISRSGAKEFDTLRGIIQIGISPRGGLSLERAARAMAWIRGSGSSTLEDVDALIEPILCHRLTISELAEKQHRTIGMVTRELCRVAKNEILAATA